MSESDHSTQIQGCIDRMRSGDASARDELLAHAADRLTRLTRKMLRDFPGVHRWEQTDDVLQNAALRLCRALGEVQPPTAADFFRLAAAQIRRELLDLARRYSGAEGLGAHHASIAGVGKGPEAEAGPHPTGHHPRSRSPRCLDRLPSRGRGASPGGSRGVRPAVLSGTLAGRGGRLAGCLRADDQAADGNRRGCGWSRPWEAGCPASERHCVE